jgi:hypothetical protein
METPRTETNEEEEIKSRNVYKQSKFPTNKKFYHGRKNNNNKILRTQRFGQREKGGNVGPAVHCVEQSSLCQLASLLFVMQHKKM